MLKEKFKLNFINSKFFKFFLFLNALAFNKIIEYKSKYAQQLRFLYLYNQKLPLRLKSLHLKSYSSRYTEKDKVFLPFTRRTFPWNPAEIWGKTRITTTLVL